MNSTFGTYRDGHVDLDSTVDWPEGSRVAVSPKSERVGMRESEWPDSDEGRNVLLKRMEQMEPLELTVEDEIEIPAARGAVREASINAVRRQMDGDR